MVDPAFVEDFYSRHQELYEFLIERGEVTFASDLAETFTRSLVLAIASYFEHDITEILTEIPAKRSNGDPVVTAMIVRQVISRKYHTYFDWDNLKPGPFWALMGPDFKTRAVADLKADDEKEQAVQAFLELGQLRNKLVHQNFVQFNVEKTPEELIQQFRSALSFPAYVREVLFGDQAS